jgi:hypothetical protein
MKNITLLIICNLLFLSQTYANESISSEVSHVIGGTLMAGGITAVVERNYPKHRENRRMIGFKVSSAAIIVLETIEYAVNGNAEGQLLDAVSHIAGSAVGAWITDKYILTPVIKNTANNEKYIGLAMQYSF